MGLEQKKDRMNMLISKIVSHSLHRLFIAAQFYLPYGIREILLPIARGRFE